MRTKRAIGLLGLALVVCVLFLVGRDQAWWAGDEVERTDKTREHLPLRTEAGSGERSTATLHGTGDGETVAQATRPAKLAAHEGSLSFHYEQGWSFAKRAVVPVEEADLVFKSCAGGLSSVTLRVPGGGLVNAGALTPKTREVKTARALYDALVRGHPDDLTLREEAVGDSRTPTNDLFLARTKRGEWLKLAIVERATTGGWTQRPVTIVFALEPEEPVFRSGAGDLVEAGFELDLATAARRDGEVQAEIARERKERERPIRERLARLDERASRLQHALPSGGAADHGVAGVLARGYASELGSPTAYRDATYSFEHATRDDPEESTRGDWDFVVDRGRDGLTLRVRTVTDDRSLIADLGALDFEAALRGAFPPGEGDERVLAVEGHLYLVHTLDTESDCWVLFRILEVTAGEDLLFEWVQVADPDPLRHAFGAEERELQRGYARLQVRSDHGGGNPHRAFLDGSKNAYVDELSPTSLDLRAPEGRETRRSAAHVEGGLVPLGKVFLVETVDVTIDIDGGEQPRVRSVVRVGPFPVLWIEDDRRAGEEPELGWLVFSIDRGFERVTRDGLQLRRRFAVRIPLRRDDERFVFVEGASFTRNDVVLEGRLMAEADAPDPSAPTGQLYKWQYALRHLLLTEDPQQAISGLQPGPEMASYLRGLRAMASPGPYRARLDLAIAHLENQAHAGDGEDR